MELEKIVIGHDRETLDINGLRVESIDGLYRSEDHPMEEAQEVLASDTKEHYAHDDIFGLYCNVNEYINCPVDTVYEYAKNIFSLEEWTFSVRDLTHVKDGVYVGREALAPNTKIFTQLKSNDLTRVVDYFCAWDQNTDLWMRYYCRFIDAQECLNKPGTVMMWLNCHHPYYDRGTTDVPGHIKASLARTDRPWVGDIWRFFGAGHRLEARNLKLILEARNKGSVTKDGNHMPSQIEFSE